MIFWPRTSLLIRYRSLWICASFAPSPWPKSRRDLATFISDQLLSRAPSSRHLRKLLWLRCPPRVVLRVCARITSGSFLLPQTKDKRLESFRPSCRGGRSTPQTVPCEPPSSRSSPIGRSVSNQPRVIEKGIPFGSGDPKPASASGRPGNSRALQHSCSVSVLCVCSRRLNWNWRFDDD